MAAIPEHSSSGLHLGNRSIDIIDTTLKFLSIQAQDFIEESP